MTESDRDTKRDAGAGSGFARQAQGEAALGCRACGARHDEGAWRGLTLLARLDAHEVRRLVRDWPAALRIEVRACACGASLTSRRGD